MRRKSFTFMEILVVLIIIGILATLGVPVFLNVIEESRARVCEENLKALKAALDIYAMENDQMPANLSKLPDEYIQRGYAKVISSRDKNIAWKIKIGEYFERLEHKNLAYAGNPAKPYLNLKEDLAKGNLNMISCPLDENSPIKGGGISYGLNESLKNMTSQAYRNLPATTLLIGDCENATFSDSDLSTLTKRHRHGEYFGLVITKDGRICVVDKKHKKVYYPGDARYKELHPWE